MTAHRPLVFGSPEAQAIAAEVRAAEAQARELENQRARYLTSAEATERAREREQWYQRLAAWNAWAQGKQEATQ